MNHRFHRTAALLTLLAVTIGAAPALAQVLDTPTVQVVQAKPSSVKLMITAGDSGAPDGFTVEWMKKTDFDAMGGWPTQVEGSMVQSQFVGTPTFNTDGTASSYQLAAGQTIEVELGQLFDETGVTSNYVDEMDLSTVYVVRVRADGTVSSPASDNTETILVASGGPTTNCTYTQGYWKTHPEAWPVTSLTLGTVNYTAAELLSILNQPAAGNGLLILAHQLIAAKLNILNGADPSAAAASIAAADALIGGLVIPPVGGGYLDPSDVNGFANTLDDYNNGVIGPGHCGTVPAQSTTWGSIKSTYRR